MTTTNNKTFQRFLLVWLGQFASSIGTGLTAFALGVTIFHLTTSAASYSLILLAAFLPPLILRPIGGVIADRIDRRLCMIIGDLGSALGVVFIIAMLSIGVASTWVFYTGIIFSAVFVALQNPAYKASVTDMLDKAHYSKGSGLVQLAESSRYIISPVVAGVLLSVMHIRGVLVIDCLTFALAAVTTLWVKKSLSKPTEKTAQDSFWRDFVSGFQYTYQHTSLFVLLLVASLITLFVGTLQALLGPMILSFASAKVFGISQTMATTGMLVSSLLIGLFSRSDKKVRLLAYGLFAAGLLFSLIGISPNIIIITLFAFLFFLALPIVNTSLDVLVRRNVADHMQARVWSIVSLISQSGMIVAFAGAGYLADHWFNPWLLKGGYFSSSIGDVIGVGPGRGIGLLYIISGLLLSATGILVANLKILTKLEVENHE